MDTPPNISQPNELFNSKTFFTLGGSATAVWLFCLVLANLDPEGELFTPKYFRFIALGLSLIIAGMMLGRMDKLKRKSEHWLIAFFNGLLIFINASGLNAVSSNLSFENVDSVKERTDTAVEAQESSAISFLSIPFFKNDVSWWIDEEYYKENKKIKKENEALKQQIEKFDENSDNLKDQNNALNEASNSLRRCQRHAQELTRQLVDLKTSEDTLKQNNKNLRKKDIRNQRTLTRLNAQVRSLKRSLEACNEKKNRIQ